MNIIYKVYKEEGLPPKWYRAGSSPQYSVEVKLPIEEAADKDYEYQATSLESLARSIFIDNPKASTAEFESIEDSISKEELNKLKELLAKVPAN